MVEREADTSILARGSGRPAAWLLLLGLLGLLTSLIGSTSPTHDEFADVPAGLAILRAADFELDARNPPLGKIVVALPALLLGAELPEAGYRRPASGEAGWWPWIHATRFLRLNESRYLWILAAARLPVALLACLLGYLVFAWSRERHGPRGGLASLALFVLCPTLLAHASLATLDVMAALWFFAAARALDLHLTRGGRRWLVLCGACTGAAIATKFSTLVLLPALGGALLLASRERAVARVGSALGRLALVGLVALAVLSAAYGFALPSRAGALALRSPPGRWLASAIPELPLPLPAAFLRGLDDALEYARSPELPVYLNGEWSWDGKWYYHAQAFTIKEPLPLLALLGLACLVGAKTRAEIPPRSWPLWLAPLALALTLVCFNRVQYGLRYALPIYPFLFVAAGRLASGPRLARLALPIGLVWLALTTLRAHPHQLSYFNEIVGGPARGYHYLADSNLDWGQDLGRLARLLREKYPGRELKLAYFGHMDPAFYGIRYEVLRERVSAAGLVAVSASYLAGEPYAITWRGLPIEAVPALRHRWLSELEPVDRAGYSIYLYEIP